MREKILWWIVKRCILTLDRDDTLMAYSFAKDEITDYHIIAERFYPDRHCYGTREEPYPELRKEE